jgi:pimeloyl-ACP methyl ester carboxylesterase
VNPYLGTIATPSWMPIETDDLVGLAARLTPRVFRPDFMARVNDPAGLDRLITYRTIALESVSARTRLGGRVRERGAAPLPCPTLVLLSDGDQTASPETARAWTAALPAEPELSVKRFTRSNHLLLLDYDAAEARTAIVGWLGAP